MSRPGPPRRGEGHQVFVAGFPPAETTEEQIFQLFKDRYGDAVISAQLKFDLATGRPRGFGFVQFSNPADAERSIAELTGTPMAPTWNLRVCPVDSSQGGGGGSGRERFDGRGGGGPGGQWQGGPQPGPHVYGYGGGFGYDPHRGPAGGGSSGFGGAPFGHGMPAPPYGTGGFGGGPGGYGPPPGLPYAPAAAPEEGVTTVFVGGVDTRAVGEPELFYAFAALGPVSSIKIPRGDKGCAFVTFQYRAHAERAYELMQGYVLGPCRLRIEWGKAQGPARGGATSGPYGAADGYGSGGGMGYGGSRFGSGGGFIDDQVPPGLSREAWSELQHTGGHASGSAGEFEGSGGGGGFDGRGYDGPYYPGAPPTAASAVPPPEPWVTPEAVRGNPYYEPLSLPGYSSDAAAPSASAGDAGAAASAPGGGPLHAAGSYPGGVGSGYGGGYGASASGYPPHGYPQHPFQQPPHQQHPYGPQPTGGPGVHPAVRAARSAAQPTFAAAQADYGSVLPGTTRAAVAAGNKAWGALHAATTTAALVAATPGGPPTDSLAQPLEGTPAAALLAAGAS
jgi:hypothetical protein